MTLLAIDTSMAACSAAILLPGENAPIQRFEPMARGHAEAIFPMIEGVLADAACGYKDLTCIAVSVGPGSFTGVRAALAAARGLSLAADIPIVSANSLEIMAQACLRRTTAEQRCGGFIVAHDARRGEFYLQAFGPDGAPRTEPALFSLDRSTPGSLGAAGLIVGSGAPILADHAASQGATFGVALTELLPDAADLARLAIRKAASRTPPTPLYLRPADAKPQTGKSVTRVQP